MSKLDPIMDMVAQVPMGTEQVMLVYVDEKGEAQLQACGFDRTVLPKLLHRLADHVHVKYNLIPPGQAHH